MMRPSASKYVSAVVRDARDCSPNTVLLHCGTKHITFKIAPCMSGEWQCQQVASVLQAIIDEAYTAGKLTAKD